MCLHSDTSQPASARDVTFHDGARAMVCWRRTQSNGLSAQMKTAAQLLVAFAPFVLAAGLPFVRVVRGASGWKWFFLCWLLLVVWMFLFCFVIPMGVLALNRELGREVFKWVPEGPAVITMLFAGWLYAGPIVWLGMVVRKARKMLQHQQRK